MVKNFEDPRGESVNRDRFEQFAGRTEFNDVGIFSGFIGLV